jgi:DNA-binding transcriptional LysR family regulator
MPTFMVMSSLTDDLVAFGNLYDDIEICLSVTNDFVSLNRREADVSIRYTGEVTDDVVGQKAMRCAKAVYCSPAYAAEMQDNGGEGLHWIGRGEDTHQKTANWIKESPFPKAELRHRIRDSTAQLRMAAAGAGLTQLPCFTSDRYPGLMQAPFQKPVLDNRFIWLLLHDDLRSVSRIRVFVDFMAARIKSRRDEFQRGAK